ncbi:GTPase domain-containing protein [Methylomonas sp. MED-D]|uniref:GTPase domain-containing protein n=1 Tax=unclassified Methylomonas TaxID=2608980 RepID=UPI0028A38FFF|nr:GTPase [Methylomonas sp. MV1]MDT4328410.1 GTPase [Methylomonas sp. MV1]
MLEFIQHLKQRYQIVLGRMDKRSPRYLDYQQRADQLLFAEAFIRKGRLIAEHPDLPMQIAVIGPTQSGKSSTVNLLLNSHQAGVSPLAGYTVQAQGFCHAVSAEAMPGLQAYFGRFERVAVGELAPGRLDCYAIGTSPLRSPLLPPCVCWDTPDFDSIDAADYREGLVRAIALADAVILLVSKEKYADQSVWDIMSILESLRQPTLIVVNKLGEGQEAAIIDSLAEKWRAARRDPVPNVVPLHFRRLPDQPSWPRAAEQAVLELVKSVSRRKHSQYQQQLLTRFWPHWLEPVYAEHQSQRHWRTLVDQCLARALKDYQRDYLNHPHHYETFQQAVLNLLTLLEIPGLAGLLAKTRRAMTWPMRKLFGSKSAAVSASQEIAVLTQIGDHVMIQLADRLLEIAETEADDARWWKETSGALRQQRGDISSAYQRAVLNYHGNFQQDVEAAAQRLYRKLQEQPLILNSLRATRATTDAGAVLLTIQAGGIGLHDLVLMPLMLTATSLLAESTLGGYMARVEADLKQHQLHTVNAALFEHCLQRRLYALPGQIASNSRFDIDETECRQAEQALQDKKHGLRIL